MIEDRVAFKQRIKEANDIVEVVGGYISLRPAGPTYKGLCPFHDDQKPSFDVDPRRQRYRCWACGKLGDVINFVQEFERVSFREALELLARRAGISLENFSKSPQSPNRGVMIDVMQWACEQFHECLLEQPQGEPARRYLGERKITGETVRRFGLGFAPAAGEWLARKAASRGWPTDVLETVGLIAKRNEGIGHYDRFRDRVMFPIRDMRGQVVGFGGRVLPTSPLADRGPKYYNSSETPLFSKSDQLYGLDLARQSASKLGYLAIVEGYTDVLMAHQQGIPQVVATMGTALNDRHLKRLRGLVNRVVLVFDADEGGDKGVDRAMEIFVKNDLDLRVANLPEGLDPCDLMVAQGPEPFVKALEKAIDVFEYKLLRVSQREPNPGVEGQRHASEEMLKILALTSDDRSVKLELMINRIAHRLRIREETLWSRLRDLRAAHQESASRENVQARVEPEKNSPPPEPKQRAPRHEVELLEVLLAAPELVSEAKKQVEPEEISHPWLKILLQGLFDLIAQGQRPDLDHLQESMDNEGIIRKARELQDRGLDFARADWPEMLAGILRRFAEKRVDRQKANVKYELLNATDHDRARAALMKLMNPKSE